MRELFIELAVGASLKEMILMLLAVVIIGTPIAWAIEGNLSEDISEHEIKIVDANGSTLEELVIKSEELEELFKDIDLKDISFEEFKTIFQGELNNVLNKNLPNGEGKPLYIKGWNTILDKINSVDSISHIFTNIFDGLMEFTLKDVFKTGFSFPKLADFM